MNDWNATLEWLNYTFLLVQRLCVVVTAAFFSIRLKGLRESLRGADRSWRHRSVATAVFALLAIVGTHSGFVMDVRAGGRVSDWLPIGSRLEEAQAIVGFRDSMVLVAGLIAGPWVGSGAGFLAAGERYFLGGFSASASSAATALLGLVAGLVRKLRPRWRESVVGALCVALVGTLLQRILTLVLAEPLEDALLLARAIAVPVTILNGLACVLFIAIVRDLDRERLEHQARQAELRAWQARVEPHFLNNTLNAIKSLIRIDPDRARHYLVSLGEFFNETRELAGKNSISLGQELDQLRRYLDFQNLRFTNAIGFSEAVAPELFRYRVPPRCLQTLAENALNHAFPGVSGTFVLCVRARERSEELILEVLDNGHGIPAQRLCDLGIRPVVSKHGSGTALHQLAQALVLAFADHARMRIDSTPGAGTVVTLILPKRLDPW